MLVMGLFAVLSWDSTFLDRRDVLVMAPLPVRPRTIFLAKAAALGAALGLTTAALNGLPGITWGLMYFAPAHSSLLGGVRALAAYWIAALAGAAFVFCAVLAAQGTAGQLPRRWYLRLSAVLQIAVFCLILGTYFLEPPLSNPQAFAAPRNQHALAWLPSYGYLGLFHALNGDATPGVPAAAWRAVFGGAYRNHLPGTKHGNSGSSRAHHGWIGWLDVPPQSRLPVSKVESGDAARGSRLKPLSANPSHRGAGKDIHLAPEIRDTLLGSAPSGAIALVFELIQRYERAEWQRVATLAECLQLECQEIMECYLTAVHCCNDVFAIGDSRPV